MALPPLILRALPLVKRLVHHEEAHLVAQVKQMGVGRVMRGAHGVAAHGLEAGEAARPDGLRHSRAEAARVVMNAQALELHIDAVEPEARVAVKADGEHAEADARLIRDRTALERPRRQGVEHRGIRAPELRLRQGDDGLPARAGSLPARAENAALIENLKRGAVAADGFILNLYISRAVLHTLGGDKHAVRLKRAGIGDLQRHVTVNTAAGEPAGIRHLVVLHAHADHIFARADKGAHIMRKGRIAIGPLSEIIAVDPHARMLIHAAEGHANALARSFLGQGEVLSVPCGAAGQIAGAAGIFLIEGMLDRPVVRQRHAAPRAVVPAHEIRADLVAEMEAPVLVQIDSLAHNKPPKSKRGCPVGISR